MARSSPYELGTFSKPSPHFEPWSWLFMRLSGLVLLCLVLGHFAMMHLIHPIEGLNYSFVVGRYRYLGWRFYDLSMLLLALLHGLNGIRILIDDYIHSERWHRLAFWALGSVGLVLAVLGTIAILTFNPL